MARFRTVALAVCALAFSACTTVSVVPARLDPVKTVAIVGYSGWVHLTDANEPSNSVGGTITAFKNLHELSSGELAQRYSAEAQNAYDALAASLQKNAGWKVLPRGAVAANPAYAARAKAAQSPHTVIGLRAVPGILTRGAASELTPAERAAMCKNLGVDALVVVQANYTVGKTGGVMIGGFGKLTKYPEATLRVSLYNGADIDPAWKDLGATGDPASVGVANDSGVQVDANEQKALAEATDSAVAVLLKRFDEAKAKNKGK